MERVGFVGLGRMGLPIATNLLRAGHLVTGYDESRSARASFVERGGNCSDDLGALVAESSLVLTMLPSPSAVSHVVDQIGKMERMTSLLVIDASTTDPTTSRKLADQANVAGFALIDAPVSGGVAGAEAGSLTFMVGGDLGSVDRVKPFLQAMGSKIVHAGEVGAGQVAKICNNLITGISMIAVAEAFALGLAHGLSAKILFEIVSKSSGQCWSISHNCPVPGVTLDAPADRDYLPGFTNTLMVKDMGLASKLGEEAALPLRLVEDALEIYRDAMNSELAEKDFSSVFQMISRQTDRARGPMLRQ